MTTENILVRDIQIPLPKNHPSPVGRIEDYIKYADGYFRGAEICSSEYDSDKKGIVFYFHGSGAKATSQDHLSNAINKMGYTFIGINNLGSGNSGPSTYRFGYGNLGMPEFTNDFIKLAWWVKAVLNHYKDRIKTNGEKVVLLGHSMGATAVMSYLAGYADYDEKGVNTHVEYFKNELQGVLVNGATIAGLGTLTWNDINRNINSMTQVFRLAQDNSVRKVICYSDNDKYAPPDYVKRLHLSLKKDSDTYLLTAGGLGHAWFNQSESSATQVAKWVTSLMNNTEINLINNKPAVPVHS